MTEVNSGNYDVEYTVPLVQTQDKWQTEGKINIAGISEGMSGWRGEVQGLGSCIVSYDSVNDTPVFEWGNYINPGIQWVAKGGKITYGTYNKTWAGSAIARPTTVKNGESTLKIGDITSDSVLNSSKYEIGYFLVDKNNNILYDSGAKILAGGNSYSLSTNKKNAGEDVDVAIQFFKYADPTDRSKGFVQVSQEEAAALANLVQIK